MAAWKEIVSAVERGVKRATSSVYSLTKRKVHVKVGVTAEGLIVTVDDGNVSEEYREKYSLFRGNAVDAEKIGSEAGMRWCESHRKLNQK